MDFGENQLKPVSFIVHCGERLRGRWGQHGWGRGGGRSEACRRVHGQEGGRALTTSQVGAQSSAAAGLPEPVLCFSPIGVIWGEKEVTGGFRKTSLQQSGDGGRGQVQKTGYHPIFDGGLGCYVRSMYTELPCSADTFQSDT